VGGVYTPKDGYVQLSTKILQQDVKWWWRKIWKQRCPTKGKILVWSILENIIPTWENIQKRQFNGLSWCSLCKEHEETIDHLLIRCPFTTSVWVEVNSLNNSLVVGNGHPLRRPWRFGSRRGLHRISRLFHSLLHGGFGLLETPHFFRISSSRHSMWLSIVLESLHT
jgi:hypothetical protein